MTGALPQALTVNGAEHPIRTDYRNVLQVLEAFQDAELTREEKWLVATYLLFEDFSCAGDVLNAIRDGFDVGAAMEQISWFISAGQPEKQVLDQPTYSWKQDEQIIFSAVNKVAGKEVRELAHLHWWTFLGYFREVGEGTFSFIVGIRHKLNLGRKLEKHEKEFLARNKELVRLQRPRTREEQEREDAHKALLDEVLG